MFTKSQTLAVGFGIAVALLLGFAVGKEYSAGPMLGHYIPMDGDRNETTISEIKENEKKLIPFEIRGSMDRWQTCSNKAGRYQIKYPEDWDLYVVLNRGAERTKVECKNGSAEFGFVSHDNYPETNFTVGYQDTYAGTDFVYEGVQSLDEYFQKRPEMAKAYPILKEVIVDGERAVYISSTRVLIYHKDRVYDISGANLAEDSFAKVLDTIKFTN